MENTTEPDRPINRRILIVDDNSAIHIDFCKTLAPRADTSELDEIEREVLQEEPPSREEIEFQLDSADQGEVGVRKVEAAAKAGEPYAMAFVDMRMPPGWDGLRTIEEMWKVDPELEVVICTAYSDHTWGEISQRLGNSHQLLILRKPFDPVEIMQLAASLTHKWELARQARQRIEKLTTTVGLRDQALDLLSHQNQTVLEWMGQPVVALNRSGQIQFANSAAAEALAISAEDLTGKSFHRIIHPSHTPDSNCRWDSWEQIKELASAGVATDSFERADGTQQEVDLITSCTRGSDGEQVGVVILFCAVVEDQSF